MELCVHLWYDYDVWQYDKMKFTAMCDFSWICTYSISMEIRAEVGR